MSQGSSRTDGKAANFDAASEVPEGKLGAKTTALIIAQEKQTNVENECVTDSV